MRRKNTRPTLIYWLYDMRPETLSVFPLGQPFYCGKTVRGVERRLRDHLYFARKSPKGDVAEKLLECGEHVRTQTMEIVPVSGNWAQRERDWISTLRQLNPDCVNDSDGGDGAPGNIHSAETRAKISAAHKGRKQSAEHLAKLSVVRKGRKLTEEHKQKVGAAFRGRTLSPEHCAKISAAKKGNNGLRGHPRYALKRAQKAANA